METENPGFDSISIIIKKLYKLVLLAERHYKVLAFLVFAFGFLMVGSYLFSIHFIPTKNLISISYLILAVSFVGLFALVGLSSAIFVVPTLIWKTLLSVKDTCGIIAGKKYFQDVSQINIDMQSKAREFAWLRIRVFLFYLISIFLWFGVFCAYYITDCEKFALYACIAMLCVMFIGWFLSVTFEKLKNGNDEASFTAVKQWFAWCKLIGFSFVSAIAMLLGIVSILYLFGISNQTFCMICFAGIIVATSGVSIFLVREFPNKYIGFGAVSIFGIIFILFIGGFTTFSTKIVRGLQLGALANRTIEVESYCADMSEINGKQIKNKGCIAIIENVDILWRMGEAYYQYTKNGKVLKVAVDANEIHKIYQIAEEKNEQ